MSSLPRKKSNSVKSFTISHRSNLDK